MTSDALPAAQPARSISDTHREHAATILERACGQGRLTLEEFSVRVGAVWAADTDVELARATEGLLEPAPAPLVGTSQPVERVVNVFGDSKRVGRWRVPRRVKLINVFGSAELDLREAVLGADAMADQIVTIEGNSIFGSVKILVPEGVEVEMSGICAFGSRQAKLAPVPRRAGTPLIQVRVGVLFGDVSVRSAGPASGSALARFARYA